MRSYFVKLISSMVLSTQGKLKLPLYTVQPKSLMRCNFDEGSINEIYDGHNFDELIVAA